MLTLPDTERDALTLLGHFFLRQQQPERALTVFAALELLEPGRIEHARCVAVAALNAGRPQRAMLALDRIALAGRLDPTFHLARSLTLLALERNDEAATAMRAWMDAKEPQGDSTPGERAA